jgi:nucleoside-diphosphate-sugar epimerase
MRIFVTGATGFVGSAVVRDLIAGRHDVLGLARSDASADALAAMGASAHRGSLKDLDSLRAGATAADGIIHLAFDHDFSRFAENCEDDRLAIEAMGSVLEGSERPMLVTSGLALIANGRLATEEDKPAAHFPRASETAALALAARGVRASMVRLAPSTHGEGDHGFVPHLINLAREKGMAAYVGDGLNRWPAVHRFDAARLFRLALEKAPAGTRLHAAAEEGIAMRTIAETVGAGLGLPVRSLSVEEAPAHFGFLARFVAADNPTSSAITRDLLAWQPEGPELLNDLRDSDYFA